MAPVAVARTNVVASSNWQKLPGYILLSSAAAGCCAIAARLSMANAAMAAGRTGKRGRDCPLIDPERRMISLLDLRLCDDAQHQDYLIGEMRLCSASLQLPALTPVQLVPSLAEIRTTSSARGRAARPVP